MIKSSQKDELQDKEIAMHISVVSIIVNTTLSVLKLFAGIFAHSGAMISDAVHSASDVFSTFIVMIGIHISSKESDEEHQYGHERMECIAAILLANVLFAISIGIGYQGIQKVIGGNYGELQIPGVLALVAAITSIVVKEWMYWYTRAGAKKINSSALMADAWHHRSDSLSSIGSFVGILGARLGFPIFDPIASIVICFFVAKAAVDIFRDAIDKLVDKSCDMDTVKQMREIILKQEGVLQIDLLQSRLFGSKIYVDIEISVDAEKTLRESHEIAEQLHKIMEQEFPRVKHCMVHVNPIEKEEL
ncbi:MAG: cation transporter [Epulopiscium sp.]|nr:cation transporter [Candidatus Epulonipiscium sp.]